MTTIDAHEGQGSHQPLTFSLTPEAEARLKRMAAESGVPLEQIISQSLSLESFLRDKRRKGAKVLLKDPDGSMWELLGH